MASVFQKFEGIRPMAAKLGLPPSTVKSWHAKSIIPLWRHASILAVAQAHHIELSADELLNVRPDDPALDIHGRDRASQPHGAAA